MAEVGKLWSPVRAVPEVRLCCVKTVSDRQRRGYSSSLRGEVPLHWRLLEAVAAAHVCYCPEIAEQHEQAQRTSSGNKDRQASAAAEHHSVGEKRSELSL